MTEIQKKALNFLKKRIPQSFKDDEQMEEIALAGKSSTFDAFIAGAGAYEAIIRERDAACESFAREHDLKLIAINERDEYKRQCQFTNSNWPHEKKAIEAMNQAIKERDEAIDYGKLRTKQLSDALAERDNAVAQCKRMEEHWRQACKDNATFQEMEAKVDVLIEALEAIKENQGFNRRYCHGKACEALAKYRETND